jgi:serine/threonine protein kinase/Tol biopolymer transport system component
MNAERWQKIEALFHAALNSEPGQRAEFLARIRATDEALCSDVESLLASHDQTDSFFEESASALAAEMFGGKVGETIGPYQVLSVLGGGGMGEVYLAEDSRLGRQIALKLLPAEFTHDKDRLRRFQQEARAASALNHPNILTVHEIELSGNVHYIATEFIDGMTLRQRISSGPMHPGEALDVAIQVASALAAAHAAGIVHRDIKPENVMLRADGYVKVLDFGLAKLPEHPASTSRLKKAREFALNTDPGVVMGTPRYMSPEQARGLAVDARTDIFSLGVMLFEMVSGKMPFDGATASDVIAALLKDEPELLALCAPQAPLELEGIIKRALAKDQDDRYQTVTELSDDLQRLKEEIKLNAQLGRIGATAARVQGAETVSTNASLLSKSTNPAAHSQTETLSSISRKRWPIVLGLGTLLVVVAVISLVSLKRNIKKTLQATQTSHPLTFRSGFISAARFAPDGKSVVYSAGFDGGPLELFSTKVDGSESHPFGIRSAGIKSVSSAGEIALLLDGELNWADTRNGSLATVSLKGGKPTVLLAGIDEADWSPDGKTLAIVRVEAGEHQLESPAGNVLYKSSGWIDYPRVSPQGNKIAFLEHPLGNDSGSVAVLDLKSKNMSLVSTGWKAVKGLAWSPSGDEIWFTGSRISKKQDLYAVTLSGQERWLYGAEVSLLLDDVSHDGRVLMAHGNSRSRILILSDDSKNEGDLTSFAWSTSADLSADGKTLLFFEWGHTEEATSVYLRKLDASEAVRLGEGKALALSPDSKWALALREKSPMQLVLLPTGGGEPRILPNHGIKEYHYGSWFPNGRQILFTALEAKDDAVLRSYVQDIDSGDMHPVTEEGTVALRVSPNGKSVFALDPDGKYYVYPLDGAAPRPIPGLESEDEPIQWSADGLAVYVRGPGDFATKIYRLEIATGRRRLLKEINPNTVGLVGLDVEPGGVMITPDGRSCVYTYWTLLQELMLIDGLK